MKHIWFLFLFLAVGMSYANDTSYDNLDSFIQDFCTAVQTNDKSAVAHMMNYPQTRFYPLRDVQTPDEFLELYHLFLPDSIRQVISSSKRENWEEIGWHGVALNYGDVWIVDYCDIGYKVKSVNVFTQQERHEYDLAVKRERQLAGVADTNMIPMACYITLDSTVLVHVWSISSEAELYRADFYYLGHNRPVHLAQCPMISLECTRDFGGTCNNLYYNTTFNGYSILIWDADCMGHERTKQAYGIYIQGEAEDASVSSFFDNLRFVYNPDYEFEGYFYTTPTYFQDWVY
jgi:hypothetical protein